MTKLEAILSDTFRLARWVDHAGQFTGPTCAECYDGEHVEEDRSPRHRRTSHAGTRAYRCRACLCRFSDRAGTPLAQSAQGYRGWAAVLLTPAGALFPPHGLARPGLVRPTLETMRGKLLGAPELAARWRGHLDVAGVTLAQILDEESRVHPRRPPLPFRHGPNKAARRGR